MSCCCCHTPSKPARAPCPACGQNGHAVTTQTLLHQVQFPDNQQLSDGNFAFCANRACAVGYFTADTTIPKSRLRAFQPGERPMLCHCVDISVAQYRTALQSDDANAIKPNDIKPNDIKQFVIAQTKQKRCACESRNPSGRCCRADFKKLEATTNRIE